MEDSRLLSKFFERAIHDLASPLHVSQFCIDELEASLDKSLGDKEFIVWNKLREANRQSVETIKEYREFLKLWQKNENEWLSLSELMSVLESFKKGNQSGDSFHLKKV